MKQITIYSIIMGIILFAACDPEEPKPIVEFDDTPLVLEYGAFPSPPIPSDNKLTVEGVELGRRLFYEKMLSKGNEQACADCHRQEDAFSDTTRFSLGVEGLPGKRQAMGVFNMLWHSNEFFWDGRAHLLRDQALKPIQDPLEMNETLENVIAKLNNNQEYKDQFIRAFGDDLITEERISLALEQFMNSIVSVNSKYDKYLLGEVTLSESEERGRALFFTEYNPFFPDQSGADCAHCHTGINFENDLYMNNGLDTDAEITDIGREMVTMMPEDRAKFKVPSLRNIERTPPYMHDGRFETLEQVIDHYNEGVKMSTTVDPVIENTRLSGLFLDDQDKADLLAFLKTLTDPVFLANEDYSNPFE